MIDEQPRAPAPVPAVDPDEVDLSELLAKLWRRKLLIAVCTLLGVGLGLYYTWWVAPAWEANASVVFPATTSSSAAGLAASLGVSLPGSGSVPLRMYRAVLESRRARQFVAKRSGVKEKDLERRIRIKDDTNASLLTITAIGDTPRSALQLVALYLEALRNLNLSLSLPQARTQAELLKRELDEKSRQLRLVEERQRRFQQSAKTAPGIASGPDAALPTGNRYGQQLRQAEIELARVQESITDARTRMEQVAQPGTKLPSDFPVAQQWRDKLANLEYNLRVEELTYGPEAPSVVKLRSQIALTRQQLEKEIAGYLGVVRMNAEPSLSTLEAQRVGLESQIRVLRGLAEAAPEETVKMQRLAREGAILSGLVQELTTQYEMQRLQVSSDPNRWEVMDEPGLSNEGRPINKRWVRYPGVVGVLGLLLGAALALATSTGRMTIRQVPSAQPPTSFSEGVTASHPTDASAPRATTPRRS